MLFTELEHEGVLRPDNDVDLFALHFLFIPRINASLTTFRSAWNNHPLSTENSFSPIQLYTAYSMGSQLFDETVDPTTYGTDSRDSVNGDEQSNVDSNVVQVPETCIPLSEGSLIQLKHDINLLAYVVY